MSEIADATCTCSSFWSSGLERRKLSGSKVEKGKHGAAAAGEARMDSAEEEHGERDPLRAAAERLQAEFVQRPLPDLKLKKAERELLAFLELHPGLHNLAELGETLKSASAAARALARKELVRLESEGCVSAPVIERPTPKLNATVSNGR